MQQCGLSTLDRPAEHYGLGLTIGNAEARLLELANAYASLARLGEYKPYRSGAQETSSGRNERPQCPVSRSLALAPMLDQVADP